MILRQNHDTLLYDACSMFRLIHPGLISCITLTHQPDQEQLC
jgi:hypothetical protein